MRRLGWWVVCAVVLAACGGDSTEPTMDSVAGTYHATTFTATDANGTIDLLAGGASLVATLAPDGTTSGALHVPADLNQGTPLDADLTGTWTLANAQVRFHSTTADTFLPDLAFAVRGTRLEGSAAFGSTTLHVILSR